VIFKDISIGRVTDALKYQKEGSGFTQETNTEDSLTFFMKKALVKGGLEVCGMRMIYMDPEQAALYEHLFNEKLLATEDHKKVSLFALFLRGVDAVAKCESIVGHFNPEMARKTNEKSVRAFFGTDKEQRNCVLKMFASQKKNLSELIFWFGGRV
jgi:nucleoside diphosphate kinase